jgi:hypothetical protein
MRLRLVQRQCGTDLAGVLQPGFLLAGVLTAGKERSEDGGNSNNESLTAFQQAHIGCAV